MVVRLLGDGSSYQKMMRDAQTSAQETAEELKKQGEETLTFRKRLEGLAGSTMSFLGGLGIKNWLNEALHSYREQEEADIKLRATLEANERAVDRTFDAHQAFAAQMMVTAGAADEVTIGMLQQAESMGITGEAAQRAVRNVIAAQAAGLPASIRMMVALEQGHSQMLGRLLPALKGIKDESERAAKAQDMLAKMFRIAEVSGQMAYKQLKLSWGELMEDFGKAFDKVITPILDLQRTVTDWFRSLPDNIKQSIVMLASLTAGVIMVVGAWGSLSFLLGTVLSGVGPILLAVVGIGAAINAWAQSIGGIPAAWEVVKTAALATWDWIKAKVSDFWAWFRPIWRQGINVIIAGWDLVKQVAITAWDIIMAVTAPFVNFIINGWAEFLRNTGLTWTGVRDFVVDTLLFVEFTLRNLSRMAELVFLGISLAAVSAFNDIAHWVTAVGPAHMAWFVSNSIRLFTALAEHIGRGFRLTFENIARMGRALPDVISGDMTLEAWAALWRPVGRAFEFQFNALPDVAARAVGDLEGRLGQRFHALHARLGAEWDAFRRHRREQLFGDDEEEDAAAETRGGALGEAFNQGLEKETKKADAVLAGSAEALSRIVAFREKLADLRGEERNDARREAQAGQGIAGAGQEAAQHVQLQRDQLEAMRRAANGIERIAARPPVQIEVEDAGI